MPSSSSNKSDGRSKTRGYASSEKSTSSESERSQRHSSRTDAAVHGMAALRLSDSSPARRSVRSHHSGSDRESSSSSSSQPRGSERSHHSGSERESSRSSRSSSRTSDLQHHSTSRQTGRAGVAPRSFFRTNTDSSTTSSSSSSYAGDLSGGADDEYDDDPFDRSEQYTGENQWSEEERQRTHSGRRTAISESAGFLHNSGYSSSDGSARPNARDTGHRIKERRGHPQVRTTDYHSGFSDQMEYVSVSDEYGHRKEERFRPGTDIARRHKEYHDHQKAAENAAGRYIDLRDKTPNRRQKLQGPDAACGAEIPNLRKNFTTTERKSDMISS
mgnify:CR=1 FL=1